MDNRREFLKKSILLSGAAGLAGAVPASVQRALDINPPSGSSYLDAEHVVILMQENRSFDHSFGSLRGVRGFNDPRAITQPDKNLVWLQTNVAGETYSPFHFDINNSKITWMGSTPHSRSSQVDAFNSGKCDNWLNAKKVGRYPDIPLTMGHFTRSDLPFNYALADAFTICDHHFCSAMSSTWPNRLYMWSGTIRDKDSDQAKAYVRNDIPYGEASWKTFPERLEENDISWKIYQNDLAAGGGFVEEERSWLANYICNLTEFLSQYNVRFSSRYVQGLQTLTETLPSEIADMEVKLQAIPETDNGFGKLQKNITKKKEILNDAKEGLLKWSKENFEKLSQYQKNLFNKAFTTNAGDPAYRKLTFLNYEYNGEERQLIMPKGDILYQFRKDVDAGQLPAVSWLVPPKNFSDHPAAPWYGNFYTSEILDILTKNPEVWKKTIFILTYDENDGYFDHIPPFVAPDPKDPRTGKCSPGVNEMGGENIRLEQELNAGIPSKEARGGPIGLGFRVPMIIASPWSRGGKVCSQVFDHTSSLQFLEEFLNHKFNKNIRETNISEWRRTVCGNLTSAFTTFEEKEKKTFPFLSRDPFLEKIYNAKFKDQPADFKKLSPQEIEQINHDPSSHLISQQEPGIRPSDPLPYQLYADGRLSGDKKSFELTMQAQNTIFGKRSAGSPFNVYAPEEYISLESENKQETTFESARVWNYAVKAGDTLTDRWPLNAFKDNKYHLRIYGPNGFFREFIGNANDPLLQIDCEYQRSRLLKTKLTGNIELKIANLNPGASYHLQITDNAYKAKAISKIIRPSEKSVVLLDLKKSFSWYDFSVAINGNTDFVKRYAGRVEKSAQSFSDPLMGKTIV